ncbi:uncharacterized protein J7T54_001328 [Emericellopsis cladophorae]|uniref:Uncharacterized protein n=1 Tax=Emericellopsis cladophorae TaxID=2686198 RepID=A0A9P9Y2U1_9HYPO|nr:uncharacterized protein J7T54_001328 [Emericellopsis cladophorae]KAI6782471.1 hypothetical protein J7T54_001328 [Emericellopsis cladophorae]
MIAPAAPDNMSTIQQAPALPQRSNRRASRFLEPINPKTGFLDEQPPLSPSHPPHEVYLSSEEEASSSADDFSDNDFDSDTEVDPLTPVRKSQEDTARVVNFVYWGKPSIVELPQRPTSPETMYSNPSQPRKVRRTTTEPITPNRRTSFSSTHSSSRFSTVSRSSTAMGSPLRHKPAFLSIDPCPSRPESEHAHDPDRPRTPKGSSNSMLKRTLSLARKRSKPHLNQAASQSSSDLAIRPVSVEPFSQTSSPDPEAALKATRRRTVMVEPPPIPEDVPTTPVSSRLSKGHSRLRGLSISLGRRKA